MYRIEYRRFGVELWTRLAQRYAREGQALRQADHFRRANPGVEVRVVIG